MYRVLIAEDELLVRMGIRSLVDWQSMNMEITCEAANGLMAWEQYSQTHPDIVITDIRMPLLDGLGLIEKIRQIDPDRPIIVLSCLDEFRQTALQKGISGYINKFTMTKEEIEKELLAAKQRLDRNPHQERPVIVSQADELRKFITGRTDYDRFAPAVQDRDLTAPLTAVLLIVEMSVIEARATDDSGEQLQRNIKNVFRQLFDIQNRGLWCDISSTRFFYVSASANARKDYMRICELLRTYMDVDIDAYFSNGLAELTALPDAYAALGTVSEIGQRLKMSGEGDSRDNSPLLTDEMRQVRDYIWLNYEKALSVRELAGLLRYNPNYFISLFKKSLGMGPKEYVLYVRMEMAKWLLSETKDSMTEICEKTGFHNESYLSKCFKEYTGMTPRAFRMNKSATGV